MVKNPIHSGWVELKAKSLKIRTKNSNLFFINVKKIKKKYQ
jgi:hypothetical protein